MMDVGQRVLTESFKQISWRNCPTILTNVYLTRRIYSGLEITAAFLLKQLQNVRPGKNYTLTNLPYRVSTRKYLSLNFRH